MSSETMADWDPSGYRELVSLNTEHRTGILGLLYANGYSCVEYRDCLDCLEQASTTCRECLFVPTWLAVSAWQEEINIHTG